MPSLARKVLIFAAVDGLILQPLSSRKEQRQPPPAKISYGDASVSQASREVVSDVSKLNSSFEAFGIVGLITVQKFSYLVSITRRQQVAQVRGFPVYVITEVALTPCSSYKDASEAVGKTAEQLRSRRESAEATDVDTDVDDDTDLPSRTSDDIGDEDSRDNGRPPAQRRSSVVEDVLSRRGSYGRFAQRWFSKSGWMQEQKRSMGLSDSEQDLSDAKATATEPTLEEHNPEDPRVEAAKEEAPEEIRGAVNKESEANVRAPALLPKLLRTTQILFGSSHSFFFSYDYDITRSLARQNTTRSGEIPLYQQVDPLFFWNKNVIQPFIDAGTDALSLPLMQGFVGQRSFVVDSQPPQTDDGIAKESVELSDFGSNWSNPPSAQTSNPGSPPNERASVDLRPSEKLFDITVISRRSTKRAGLRYLRRGIDEQGFVANSVETEQILCPRKLDELSKIYSFVQIRGSIPIFFTQSPYSIRPAPVFRHSEEANYQALKKHFEHLRQRYGSLQIVNMVEKHGIEAPIGEQFQRSVEKYNKESPDREEIPFEWFDFHAVCRGMKFENVSQLIQLLGKKLETFGSSIDAKGELVAKQSGVFRSNCLDCLDRTNVCQSSFAKHMLDLQLKEQGFDMAAQTDQVNSWFNTLWADNGDAISKQYASTGAMKGDYTRTRKRNYRGALTDAGLSLSRMWNGMFNDFFLQATIDFLLGNVTSLVFDEFEANMMTQDPAISIQNRREQAIELSQKRVIADESEDFVGAWTLLSPSAPDSINAQPFEEVVFLLTDKAAYLVRFDWNLDKVSSFERVQLSHVRNIKFGTYITSTLSPPVSTDENRNVGLVISYKPGTTDITRVNTRSLSSMTSSGGSASGPAKIAGLLARRPAPPETKKIALKAPYTQSSLASGNGSQLSEIALVTTICAEIERLAFLNQPVSGSVERKSLIEEGDIISFAEAKRSTGYLEQLGHSIKKLVWA
ncbi:Phosphatidylinositide phosphatase SAC2 [Pleurostoma richardsiae]|uniref:Phosphatidylinositide phosphatase SAC2 n=1 Tax=Pleurostoma richardsiae TaxID=41990 RepID=A0AA38S4Y7_9PEZI|nr:Phosphatidylinositide phosphatase SAC2 [Pleurostoma richardsiae]